MTFKEDLRKHNLEQIDRRYYERLEDALRVYGNLRSRAILHGSDEFVVLAVAAGALATDALRHSVPALEMLRAAHAHGAGVRPGDPGFVDIYKL